jgi:hypothetical protein
MLNKQTAMERAEALHDKIRSTRRTMEGVWQIIAVELLAVQAETLDAAAGFVSRTYGTRLADGIRSLKQTEVEGSSDKDFAEQEIEVTQRFIKRHSTHRRGGEIDGR